MAVASAAAEADAIVTADMFRADLPGIVADRVAWVTWVTHGRIAPPQAGSSADGILLADERWMSAARAAGWPAERIGLASWPTICRMAPVSGQAGCIGLLVETIPLEPPQRVKDYSSHAILWKLIAEELASDPLAVGSDPGQYLVSRMKGLKISREGFDAPMFLEKLILPAFHQGLARLLAKAGLPVAVGGRGWDLIPEFQDLALETPQGAEEVAAAGVGALIHPWPAGAAHAFDLLGIPLIRPGGLTTDRFLSQVRDALMGKSLPIPRKSPPLSRGRVAGMIPGMRWPQEQFDPQASD